ncbi:MAG TPA: hypothetical protein VHQ04_05575, partial [Puia sp.]|nr:hypothetical protein [Puia sp.]
MKIFTLLQNLLEMITGQTSRNLTFKSLKLKAQSVKPNSVLSSNEDVPQLNKSVQNMMAPINDAFVSVKCKTLPVQNAEVRDVNEKHSVKYKMLPLQKVEVPASEEKYSVEYKILPVQQTKTSVQKIKPVVMQNFFAIVKKIFSLSDHPKTLLDNLNDGYHPGCSYGTANTQNISRTNQTHDVANDAASFALIPIALTPTAMNQLEKKTVKTVTGRSGIFGIIMLMSSLCFVSTAMAQTTYFSRASANWNVASTWSTVGFGGAASATVPGALDIVNIGNGNTVTFTASASCASVN